jgi:hypothetical protein
MIALDVLWNFAVVDPTIAVADNLMSAFDKRAH